MGANITLNLLLIAAVAFALLVWAFAVLMWDFLEERTRGWLRVLLVGVLAPSFALAAALATALITSAVIRNRRAPRQGAPCCSRAPRPTAGWLRSLPRVLARSFALPQIPVALVCMKRNDFKRSPQVTRTSRWSERYLCPGAALAYLAS